MTYKVGIIGLGYIAEHHADTYAAVDELDCIAIADIDGERVEEFGDKWNIPDDGRYRDYNTMLDNVDVDIVVVCTPTTLHEQHTVDAARSSADPSIVFVEKPISTSVEAADTMIAVCEKTNTELLVNHTRRFLPEVRQLKALIDRNEIVGDITAINTQWKEELLRNGTHQVDLLVFFTDSSGADVFGGYVAESGAVSPDAVAEVSEETAEFDDAGAAGLVRLADGTIVTIDCSQPRSRYRAVTDITGTAGRLHIHWNTNDVRYWSFDEGGETTAEIPGVSDVEFTTFERKLTHAASHLVNLMNGDAENVSPGVEARDTLEILIGIYIAASTGGTVSLPLDEPFRHVTVSSH